ncbi:MAG: hypothetical protein LBD29_11110 [Treponema sp.]|jgi:hypothetical protein|nr:hypothetical protein [Treponema sp.]
MKIENLIGKKYGRWTVMSKAEKGRHIYYECCCDCGAKKKIRASSLISGRSKSCGCLLKERLSQRPNNIKHNKSSTRLYKIWSGMKKRCNQKMADKYKDYASKGIVVCKEWQDSFLAFYDWSINNGYADNLSIDRINPKGNYEPNNCRWASNQTQSENRQNVVLYDYFGEKLSGHALSIRLGFWPGYVREQIRSGKKILTIEKDKIVWEKQNNSEVTS